MPSLSDDRFVMLYRNHYRHIYAYCRRRTTQGRVDDAVADTFLTAWRKIESIPAGQSELAWLYGVAYKVIGHQWRSARRQRQLERKLGEIGTHPEVAVEVAVVAGAEAQQALEAAQQLKASELEILRLAIWEELPHADIGVVLGINANAVKQRLHRARQNLVKEYGRLQDGRNLSATTRRGGAA